MPWRRSPPALFPQAHTNVHLQSFKNAGGRTKTWTQQGLRNSISFPPISYTLSSHRDNTVWNIKHSYLLSGDLSGSSHTQWIQFFLFFLRLWLPVKGLAQLSNKELLSDSDIHSISRQCHLPAEFEEITPSLPTAVISDPWKCTFDRELARPGQAPG